MLQRTTAKSIQLVVRRSTVPPVHAKGAYTTPSVCQWTARRLLSGQQYHTVVNNTPLLLFPPHGRASRRILPPIEQLTHTGYHDHARPFPLAVSSSSSSSSSISSSAKRTFSANPSVGPGAGPGQGGGPGGPGNFPWVGAAVAVGGLVVLFFLGKFLLIGVFFVGALLLIMKTTRSTSVGRQLSRSVGINPHSLTGKQIVSSIIDSALIRLGKRMLADQYANLTFHGLLQQKLNESLAVQQRLGPVILTDFSKEEVYDDEPGIKVEGEIRDMNGRVVGWLYSQSGVQEVSMMERKGIRGRLASAWEKIRQGGRRQEQPRDQQEDLSDTLQKAVEAVPEYIYNLNQLEIHVTSPLDEDEIEEIVDLTTSVSGEYRAVEFAPDWEDIQDDIPSEYIDTFEKFYKSRQEYYRRHTSRSEAGANAERRQGEASGPSVIDVEYREKK